MVYFDDAGRRIHRPIEYDAARGQGASGDSGSPASRPADNGPDDAKARYIRRVAEENPKATPDEVYAEIYNVLNRHDISRDMVRLVLAKRRPHRVRRFFRL
ncbi:hypothetical protein [Streptomyces griseorubiginosus]|uniref:hypothetical protein n=1 Tax=Streptomyces griseorubiginosus TaxID=67304 RepID=UPI003683C906